MNKSELVEAVASAAGLDRKQAEAAVSAFAESVVTAVRSGENVSIFGFGTFKPTTRKAREGRNPRTGAKVDIPESNGVKFQPSAGLKTVLNAKKTRARKAAAKKAPATTVAAKATAAKATAAKATASRATAARATAAKATAARATASRATAAKAAARTTAARATAKAAPARASVKTPVRSTARTAKATSSAKKR